MPNTYTQIYIHYVFAVHSREALIDPSWKDRLYQYMIGIIEKRHQYVLSIGGMHDHIHLLVSMTPTISPSDFMADVKRASSKWVTIWYKGDSHGKKDLELFRIPNRKLTTWFNISETKTNTIECGRFGKNMFHY